MTLLGVDKGEKERLLVTALIAIPRKARPSGGGGAGGAGGGGGGGTESRIIISAEGEDMNDALSKIDKMSSRVVTTMHTQLIILGEEFAKDDVSPVADVFTRNLDFRQNTLIAVCKGKAGDFLRKMSSPEETEISNYLVQLLTTVHKESGMAPLITMHDFVVAYGTVESEPWAPYLSLASTETQEQQEQQETKKQDQKGTEDTSKDSQKGKDTTQEMPNIVDVQGACVFKKVGESVKMVGTLDPYETMAVLMLQRRFEHGNIDIAMASDPQARPATIELHHLSVSASAKIQDGIPKVHYTVRLTCSLEETLSQDIDITPKILVALVQTIQDQVRLLLSHTLDKLKGMGSDVVDLGMEVHKNFSTWSQWENYNWPERFKDLQVDFDVKAHLFTSGFTLSPPTPR